MGHMKQRSIIVFLLILVVAAFGGFYLYAHKQDSTTTSAALSGCRAETIGLGASSNCVKDIQTMTDYMETSGLTECQFTGGHVVPITGTYDAATEAQVKVVQNWANCYYEQEGINQSVTTSGSVDNGTWTELCNYAYNSPKQSGENVSSYTKASIAAGENAHC
jgi:hypothetical protein